MKKITKTELIRRHLIAHNSINSLDAIKLYGETRLSAVIFNLKKEKWKIDSSYKVRRVDKYALYILRKAPKKYLSYYKKL